MPERDKRVILKLTGELFQDDKTHISFPRYDEIARKVINVSRAAHVQMAIVVGGGNIFRGREADSQVDHTEADSMGMMATVINGVGLREALTRNGAVDTRLMAAFNLPQFAEPFIRMKARHHLSENRLVVLAGGLGQPNFSTDSAVAQYADELLCEIIFKASTVDGVYDSDPHKNPNAVKHSELTFDEAMGRNLRVMDKTAFAMCSNSGIPIFVFHSDDLDKLPLAIQGDYSFGTLIHK